MEEPETDRHGRVSKRGCLTKVLAVTSVLVFAGFAPKFVFDSVNLELTYDASVLFFGAGMFFASSGLGYLNSKRKRQEERDGQT